MARSRRRKERRPRNRRARRNSKYGLTGADLEELSKAGAPELALFPVNPLSLRWASEVYLLQQEFAAYHEEVLAFLQEAGAEVRAAVLSDPGAGIDEAALSAAVTDILAEAETDPDPDVMRLLPIAKKLFPKLGLQEEMEAISPIPNLGVLAGQGLLDGGVKVKGDIRDRVLSLDRKVAQARNGLGYPIEEVGKAGSNLSVAFVAMGRQDDPEGMALMPPGPTADGRARTAAGIIRAILARGLWDPKSDPKKPGWVPGAKVYWAMPEPFYSAKGTDVTRSTILAGFVCTREMTFAQEGVKLQLGFDASSQRVAGKFGDEPLRGGFEEKANAYVLQVGRQGGRLTLTKNSASITVGAEPSVSLPLVSVGRRCPGPGMSYFMEPPVVNWLRSGVELLMQKPSSAEITAAQMNLGDDYELVRPMLARILRRDLTPGEVNSILARLERDLPMLPMSFVGRLQGEDGLPRYLPAEGPVSWYGSTAAARSFAAQRFGKRVLLSGKTKDRPPPFLVLQMLAERGKKPFAKNIEAIRQLRAEMTLASFAGLEGHEQKKAEERWFKAGTPAGKAWVPPASISLEGTELCSICFTVYGPKGGNYGVVWQSDVLSGSQVAQIVEKARAQEASGSSEEAEEPFSPLLALRRWVAMQSGLLGMSEEEPVLAPPAIVATMLVDLSEVMRRPDRTRLGKPLDVGKGSCNGRSTRLGLMLTALRLPVNKNNVPVQDLLLAVRGPGTGLVPAKPTQGDYWALSENLVQVGMTRGRQLLPLMGTPWRKPDLFTFDNVAQTKEFDATKERLLERADEKGNPPPSPEFIYAVTLTDGVQLRFLGGRTPDVVVGGRRAFSAFGGTQAQAGRVGQKGTSSWRLVSPDPGQRVWATKKSAVVLDIFNFAASVCKAVGCVPHGPRKTERGAEDEWKRGLSSLKGDEQNIVAAKLAEYNIEVDYEDPRSVRDALVQLRRRLRAKYSHSIETGQLAGQLQVAAAAIEELPEDSLLLDTYLDEGIDEISEFAPEYLDRMAKLNGRRPRRRRKPRRSRRSRRNPLTPIEVEEAVAYAESRAKEPEPGELPRAFEKLRRKEDPEQWELTRDRVDTLFPREFSGRGTWRPSNRFPTLEKYNMVSRVGPLDPNSDIVKQGRVGALNADMVASDQAARALMLAEAGLSLDEATKILAAQAGKKSSGFTMQPSSAICKLYRSRRLTAYRVPAQVLAATGSDKPQLLLMSPKEVYQPRVMTFRRASHLDCDMTGSAPEDMPVLLGRALQAAMYWAVEKKRRHAVSDIWVGRVGQPDLFLALRRGEPVTLAQVSANLQRAEAGEEGYRVPIYENTRQAAAAMERDVNAYVDAVRTQIGADAAERRPEPVRPTSVQARPASPAEVPMGFGFEGDEEIEF